MMCFKLKDSIPFWPSDKNESNADFYEPIIATSGQGLAVYLQESDISTDSKEKTDDYGA